MQQKRMRPICYIDTNMNNMNDVSKFYLLTLPNSLERRISKGAGAAAFCEVTEVPDGCFASLGEICKELADVADDEEDEDARGDV
jgi:hypothetical protein